MSHGQVCEKCQKYLPPPADQWSCKCPRRTTHAPACYIGHGAKRRLRCRCGLDSNTSRGFTDRGGATYTRKNAALDGTAKKHG